MRRISLTLILLFQVFLLKAQTIQPFIAANESLSPVDHNIKVSITRQFDKASFEKLQASIPDLTELSSIKSSTASIDLPLATGELQRLFIAEDHVLSAESATLYPLIKTYKVISSDGSVYGSITYSQLGFSVMLVTPQGRLYITPFSNTDPVNHAIYYSKDYHTPPGADIKCQVGEDNNLIQSNPARNKTTAALGDCTLRNYRLAVAATGEFTIWAGSQANAIASITTTIANVNVIYERDVAIHFILIIDNALIFTDSLADPYPTALNQTTLDNNTAQLNTVLGTSGYDVGIVFNNGWNGGLAYTPAVCHSMYKGGAGAGIGGSPSGSIMENVVAHEVAHMFSALHTMSSGTSLNCGSNLSPTTAYEPGGGSSLMAYAGSVCPGMWYQPFTDAYFHYNSVNAILSFAQGSATCNTTTANPNTAPILTVPATSYTIPRSTPFELTTSVSDPGATATPTYTFDQYDLALDTMTAPPTSTATSGPVFRSYPPSTTHYRIFPPLTNILANTTPVWEVLPSVARTLNFRIIVRDNEAAKGCVAQESVAITVDGTAGPFAITSQNTASPFVADGVNTIPLTWNVASSDVAPVNSPNVDILFSADSGKTFPYTLLANSPNDGSENILVPNLTTQGGRIKIKSSNNIFFDINNAAITITSSCAANGATFTPSSSVSATAGAPALNLGLTPTYGAPVTITGTLANTDPSTTLTVNNVNPGACINFSNTFTYDLFTFQVNVSGSYTFTRAGVTSTATIFNLYQSAFVSGNPCTNFLNSNGTNNGSTTINASFSQVLSAGTTYVMAVGTFSSSQPTLPSGYTINVIPPAGGALYSGTPDPGASFAYRYVIVNASTGNITAIASSSDMSNAATYPPATYTVYGLSVSTAATLTSYIGNSFTAFQSALLNSTVCGNLSTNSITVTIAPGTSTWTGSSSTSWNTAGNWSPASVPTSSSDVTIPSGVLTNEPTVDGVLSVNSLSIATGRTVTITNPNSLSVASSLSNNGTVIGTGSVILNGTSAQTISGTGTLANIQLNNTAGASISSGMQSLTGLLTVTSGTLATGGNLTLKSTSATNTALVGPVTGAISGDVIVERCLSQPAVGSSTGRSWRLLTAPVKGSTNTSVFNNWQNSGSFISNTGVEIWGPSGSGSSGNGLALGAASSLRTYSNTSNAYVAVSNTTTTPLFDANSNKAFLLFASGPYGSNLITSGAAPTTLKATGSLITGTQNYQFTPPNASNNLQLIGNPYACPIDFDKVYAHSTNVSQKFWTIDPNLNGVGGYVTVTHSGVSGYSVAPASSQNQYIQNGQAFFVEAASVAQATVQIQETDKETSASQTAVFRTNGGTLESMRINLNKVVSNAPLMIDGVLLNCHQNLSNAIGTGDASKFFNFNENITILSSGSPLAIEGRQLLDNGDTVKVGLATMQQTTYQLEIVPDNFNAPGLTAILHDNFLNTTHPVSLSGNTIYPFSVTSNPASTGNARFTISFSGGSPLDVNFLNVRADIKENMVDVFWNVANESGTKVYEVEGSTDGRFFHKIGAVGADGSTEYSFTDEKPFAGKKFYRVKAVARSTSGIYSRTIVVNMGSQTGEIITFPNPVSGGSVQINVSNLQKGRYTFSLINVAGQKVADNSFDHEGGSSAVNISVENFASGLYLVRLINEEGTTVGEQKLIRQ